MDDQEQLIKDFFELSRNRRGKVSKILHDEYIGEYEEEGVLEYEIIKEETVEYDAYIGPFPEEEGEENEEENQDKSR